MSFTSLPLRLIFVVGPGAFVVVAVILLLIEGRLLQISPGHAATMILILESTATLSIGATLAALFLGGRPKRGDGL